jgi:hypothetical protein
MSRLTDQSQSDRPYSGGEAEQRFADWLATCWLATCWLANRRLMHPLRL